MNNEPYAPPESELHKKTNIRVPEEIRKKIKNAWIAGLISITITLALTLISLSGSDILGLDATAFIDVGVMAIFTLGIYKNSRVCAVLMLVFFVAGKIIMWMDSGVPSGLPLALVFLWFYSQGVIGTFQYHRYMKTI